MAESAEAAASAAPAVLPLAAESVGVPFTITEIVGEEPEVKTDRITVNGVEVGPTNYDPVSELTFLVLPRGDSTGTSLSKFKWIAAALNTNLRDADLPPNNVLNRLSSRTDMNV